MRINYDSGRELKAFLAEHQLGMRKKFGQNFLINRDIRNRLVDALEIGKGEAVWEIGPGLGAMTRELLNRGGRVRAFEIDSGFIRILKEHFAGEKNFTLVEGDVLKTWPEEERAGYLLGNLPYNIGAALLADFIEQGRFFKRMVITVQKEVARRAAALPGSPDYSSFSVLCASAYTVTSLMIIRGSSFYPAPHVDSQGLRLDRKTGPDPAYPPLFYPLVRGLFSSRRKMVKNNLQSFVSSRIMKEGERAEDLTREILETCGLRGDERAETLDITRFGALAKALEDKRKSGKNNVHN
ncbi:MAG: 16S rRNA (adenine(1518)-N(6)/adenine(1519)-N(6))-dimethyltransferase RsmA [Treponema sp.]|jgi:16S rRNA (adenine1518-N6/adenine1519-N6)-dimethyltransferase|nr:16S rRNA (adenine(1518)-N(6)/adenine(1519)-N(6))-dimethyltransferase RsmA [Treponema sp.]